MDLIRISRRLARDVNALEFAAPVTHVYNPLDYAAGPHEEYLRRFGGSQAGRVILVGMNPGPFGMAQTGVPFGEVGLVRDWLGIRGPVGKPDPEHPKRPILGFSCQRSEVSGSRLWGWARERCESPERFFERFFVINYCPLVFLEETGRNRTPDKLPADERQALYEVCDRALAAMLQLLAPTAVVGIGSFAHNRVVPLAASLGVNAGMVLHPSPASPRANRGWAQQADEDFRRLGLRV